MARLFLLLLPLFLVYKVNNGVPQKAERGGGSLETRTKASVEDCSGTRVAQS